MQPRLFQIRQQLSFFGLDPKDWQILPFPPEQNSRASVQIENRHDSQFILFGRVADGQLLSLELASA
ncbi:MAG: hypothetical protein AB7N80_15000 [Bdellovibrionales bacterium]